MVLRQAFGLTAVGACVGLAGALVLSRLMSGLLYGVSTTDPFSFGVVSVLLTAVGVAASYIPARRATGVDPIVALRG
jgi:putative ABC transport system permease protein